MLTWRRACERQAQLESGRPAEQQMFSLAREQAKRDEEVTRLRGQLKSLRDMLRESHKVLKHLMSQEALLKEELASTRRNHERADGLNLEYLKNVLVAFLLKVGPRPVPSPPRPRPRPVPAPPRPAPSPPRPIPSRPVPPLGALL